MASRGKYGKVIFSSSDIEFIKKNFHQMNNPQIAIALGVTLSVLRAKCHELGLKHMEMEYWTKPMITFLKYNYKKIGDLELSEIFQKRWPKNKPWTNKHIEKKRVYLKLDRTPEELQRIKRRNVKAGRFSINHWRRWEGRQAPEREIRTWRNQFQRPVRVIKINGKWIHHAPWLWQQHNGPVPDGMVVGVKDNNPTHIAIENLVLRTRAEHAINNAKLRRKKSFIPIINEKLKAAKIKLDILQQKINQLQ